MLQTFILRGRKDLKAFRRKGSGENTALRSTSEGLRKDRQGFWGFALQQAAPQQLCRQLPSQKETAGTQSKTLAGNFSICRAGL